MAEPTVRPTRWQAVVVAALAGAAAVWLLFNYLESMGLPLPAVPVVAAVAIAVLAVTLAWLARVTHRDLRRGRGGISPARAVALLALARSAVVGGAALAGGYLGIAAASWARRDAELPHARLVAAAWSALACAGLLAAGVLLERACRIPPDDTDDDPRDDSVSPP